MKKIIAGMLFLSGIWVLFGAGTARAQSIGFLMNDADLVVAGETVSLGSEGRVDLYSVKGCEVLKGTLDQTEFRVGCFSDVCCHVHMHSGKGSLLFLRRLEGDIDGVDTNVPLYTVLHGELGTINYAAGEENAVLEMARMHAAMLDEADAGVKAEAMARIFRTALESGIEPLLYSAAYDLVATPGAIERLDTADEALAVERFQASGASSRLRGRMLLMLGEAQPAGLVPLIEDMVRTEAGRFYLEPSAAILGVLGDAGTGYRLIHGFPDLSEVEQGNVLFVLGRLGNGKGIAALETLVDEYAEALCDEFIDALCADRSDAAVNVLSMMTERDDAEVALPALGALGRINTASARNALAGIAASTDSLDENVVEKAAEILDGLAR